MNWGAFTSLRFRLIALLLLAVLPISGLVFYTAHEHRKLAAVVAQEKALRLVRGVIDNQRQQIETVRDLLIALSNAAEIRSGSSEECGKFTATILREYPLYTNIGVARTDGEVFCTAVASRGRVNVADRRYIKAAIADKAFTLSDYQIGRMTGKPVLIAAYPVFDGGGATKGVVFIGLDLDWLNELFAQSDIPDRSSLTAIDATGTILARYPNPAKWIGQSASESWITKTISAQREGVADGAGLDDHRQLFAFSTGLDGKMAVWASIPSDVAFAEADRIFRRNLFGVGIIGLLVLAAAGIVGQWSILHPVNALIATSERLGAGDLRARTHLVSGKGELGRLAASFDRMAESLEKRYTELQTLRDIDLSILSTLDLRSSLEILLDKITSHLPYSAATVRICDKKTGLLEPAACSNADIKLLETCRDIGSNALPNLVFQYKAPLAIHDIESEVKTADREFLLEHGYESYFGLPLNAKGEWIGVLSFYTKETHRFSGEEIAFLAMLAGQASISINNALLYQRTKQQAVDLEKANKGKDEFLGVVSHELRTPLNVIKGYAELMKDRVLGEVNSEQESALGKIMSQSMELLRMINGVLQATTLEAQAVTVQRHEFNLSLFIDALRGGYNVPDRRQLTIRWDYPRDLPVVRTDDGKLKAILQNLLNNAIKFTEQGSVIFAARHLAAENTIEFTVADSGIGIPEEKIPLIFDRFQQVDSSLTREHGGVGLGLYICRRFTELLGGTINVKSKPGEGSTFIVRVPVDFEPEAQV